MTQLTCGLIGENIGKSRLSRALGLMCADHGLGLSFTPIDTHALPDFDFAARVEQARRDGWTGVTVTHPWKTQARAWAGPAMVAGARTLGASNTLTFDPVAGHNTDYSGFLDAFTRLLDRPPGAVAVAGAGGVAHAIVPALISLGAGPIHVWDTLPGAAEALAERTGATAIALDDSREATVQAEGLINCTPLGMHPNRQSAFQPDTLGPQGWAFDAVYTPTDTPFLGHAAKAGLAVMTGFDLFRFMAMQSFTAYTGITPDAGATLEKLDTLRP